MEGSKARERERENHSSVATSSSDGGDGSERDRRRGVHFLHFPCQYLFFHTLFPLNACLSSSQCAVSVAIRVFTATIPPGYLLIFQPDRFQARSSTQGCNRMFPIGDFLKNYEYLIIFFNVVWRNTWSCDIIEAFCSCLMVCVTWGL